LALALTDWYFHALGSPGTLTRHTLDHWQQSLATFGTPPELPSGDPRYADPAWHAWPYKAFAYWHHVHEDWWQCTAKLRGMEHHHQDVVAFVGRQWLDMLSPSNSPWLNPEVWQTTQRTHGLNWVQGLAHLMDDLEQHLPIARTTCSTRSTGSTSATSASNPHPYQPGIDVACTPGVVIHHNPLVELIQYTPQTTQVQREPIFIVPSWIMKYYILDLSPHNSLVHYLVQQGHTVFIVSWRNPDASDALLDMHDYLALGVFNPLAVITERTGGVPIHTMGYCLGGTLLAIAASALSRPNQVREAHHIAPIASMSLLTAQIDFHNAGELGVFLDEAQVSFLDDLMSEQGYLSGQQMAHAFKYLRARDLFWSARVREYWLGKPDVPNDLMSWNADVTRMPAAMHSQYLHAFYLHNALAEGRYEVEGEPVSLSDIRAPIFVLGTVKDHVTPWQSAYQVLRLTATEVTFVLASGGHNAGVISPPGVAHRSYQQLTTQADAHIESPATWQLTAPTTPGSWWPAWHDWLVAHSSASVPASTRQPVGGLAAAPGSYVLVRYDD
jgi:polyhydroxyalkanoate synthase